MRHLFLTIIGLFALTSTVTAQLSSILGNWETVDDRTGYHLSMVSIYQGADGLFYGKIAKILVEIPFSVCELCKDEDHNAPLEGLVIIRKMQYDAERNCLVGGHVLDPESGKFYYGKIYPKNGNLVLRGSLDRRGLFGRNQTWVRP